jgi:flavin reductase (DIM6/NTAB) family NADH-FMN oxidoreductase RutF
MERRNIPIADGVLNGLHLFDDALLLTAGDFLTSTFNAMTISWGSLGTMWNRPFVQVVVRPSRYTFQFMEEYDTFTLSAFADQYRDALDLLGTRSGREGDKIKASGLTPVASTIVAAPSFAEADLVLECKKIYFDDIEPAHFLASYIAQQYQQQNFHRIYFGEILGIWGIDKYLNK